MAEDKCKKGQFFSYDAIIAAILFGIVVSLIFIYWISMRNFIGSEVTEMFSSALSISDSLMKPGSPENWHVIYNGNIRNAQKIQSVGLTDGYSTRIDLGKFSNFTNLTSYEDGYQRMRESYGLFNYEFYVLLEYGSEKKIAGKYYESPSGKISFRKPVVVEEMPGNLTVTVWRK
jgi:hypothetical protein